MPVRFVLDENLRGKPIWHVIRRSQMAGPVAVDAVRVGDPPDLPLGSPDPAILIWAEVQGRILISGDSQTLPVHLAQHLHAGRNSAGIFVFRPSATPAAVLQWLELVVMDDQPDQWVDRLIYIP
jgi:hypothetical protein